MNEIYLDNPEALYLQRNMILHLRISAGDRTLILSPDVEAYLRNFLNQENRQLEASLEYALKNIPKDTLTLILREHGYQPIPTAKKAKRAKALSQSKRTTA